jgi:hypothetical protein
MKRFARCANCCQWYVHAFTMVVEIYQGSQLQQMTVWCYRCIADAEHRSQQFNLQPKTTLPSIAPIVAPSPCPVSAESPDATIELFVQEHLQLMDRAMREDDTVLVPLIEDFMLRCSAYYRQIQTSEEARRLLGNLQYWDAFLKALQQSP